MKVLVELLLIWAGTVAIVLAFVLVNLWLVNHILILAGASAAKYIVALAIILASAWVFGTGSKRK